MSFAAWDNEKKLVAAREVAECKERFFQSLYEQQ